MSMNIFGLFKFSEAMSVDKALLLGQQTKWSQEKEQKEGYKIIIDQIY